MLLCCTVSDVVVTSGQRWGCCSADVVPVANSAVQGVAPPTPGDAHAPGKESSSIVRLLEEN